MNSLKNKFGLSGDYIAGFVDGEGCFALKFRKDRKQNKSNNTIREYFYWGVEFVITLRTDDIDVLKSIMKILKCGSVIKVGNSARYSIQNPNILSSQKMPKKGAIKLMSGFIKEVI